jgi:N-acyl-L-homoserine lactone synthetase
MMYMVDQKCFGAFQREIVEMHRLRYRVFKERLNWDVTVSGDMEIDEYDALKPIYLLYCNDDDRVEGCVRFLPTIGPTMLRDSFPALLGTHPPPNDPRIWESSRFSLDIDPLSQRTDRGTSRATYELLAGMGEFGLMHGLTHIVTVTDIFVERIVRRAGVPWRRIHDPQRIGNSLAVAGFAEISEWIVDELCALGGLRRPVITAPTRLKETA